MCDGDLPTRYTPEIFYSGSYFKKEDSHQTEERYHFYQSLCSWNKTLYLTVPSREENKELIPSNFLTEFSALFAMTEKDSTNYSDKIYSKEEFLSFVGSNDRNYVMKVFGGKNFGVNLDDIYKSIDINEKRLNNPFGESEYTGFVRAKISNGIEEKLESLKQKDYSITQLETYASCPYKYFAERILMLKPPEEPREDIEVMEMGSLLHVILYEFYKTLHQKKIALQNCSNDDFRYAEDLIFTIANEKIKSANFNSPLTFYEKEKILGIDGNKHDSILYKFLEEERKSSGGFTPEFFEFGFGNLDDDKERRNLLNIKVGEISIRGKIDRIDLNKESSVFKIIDYKLGGKKPSINDLLNGLSLQLPIYMYAAKELIKVQLEKDFNPVGAEIFSLKFNRREFGKMLIKITNQRKKISQDKLMDSWIENNERMINISLDAVKNYVNSMVQGKFNLSTLSDREKGICRYCSFKSICRIQEVD